MSILYSIPVHECEECIKQICDGILFFDNDAIIVLHISDSQSIDFFKSYSDRILINKKQFATNWGWDLAKVHVSNYLYVKNNFNFDISHVIFLSSNCLMIKNPKDFIKDYDIGFSEFVESYLNPNYKNIKEGWYKRTPPIIEEDYQIGWGGPFLNDERYLKILEELNSDKKYGCMIDGCYVKSYIMDKMCYFYNKYFSDEEYLKYINCPEEIIFPTISCNLTHNISDSLLYYHRSLDLNLFSNSLEFENVYFIKGVERDVNNDIREYYKKLISIN